MTIWTRSRTPSLRSTLLTWLLTVASETTSSAAISEFESPRATSRTTPSSRSDRNPRAICDGVIRLRDGSLTFLEVFRFNDRERQAAITGGTGAYAGATGTYRGGGDLGKRDEIRLLLPAS